MSLIALAGTLFLAAAQPQPASSLQTERPTTAAKVNEPRPTDLAPAPSQDSTALLAGDRIRLEIRDETGRMVSQNNLKQIALAATVYGCQGSQGPGRTTISGPEVATSRSLAGLVTKPSTLKRATLFARKQGGDLDYKIELEDILITSAQPGRPANGQPQTLNLSYSAMSWTAQGRGCPG